MRPWERGCFRFDGRAMKKTKIIKNHSVDEFKKMGCYKGKLRKNYKF